MKNHCKANPCCARPDNCTVPLPQHRSGYYHLNEPEKTKTELIIERKVQTVQTKIAPVDPTSWFFFLVGSSAVGKTKAMNAFPDKVNHVNGHEMDVVKVDMSVRKIREQLGNPKWDDLLNDQALAEAHQKHVGDVFRQRIEDTYANSKPNTIYLFERSPFDVLGYSQAFFVRDRLEPENYPNSLWFFRKINPNVEYAIEEARPPELVRDICDAVLNYEAKKAKKAGYNLFLSEHITGEGTARRMIEIWHNVVSARR